MEPPNPGVYFLLAIVSILFLTGVAYLILLIARWNSNRIRYVTPHVRSRRMQWRREQRFAPAFDPEPEPELVANAASECQNPERTGAFALNPDECAAVARMIEHKTTAEKPTKASTIWAGFGIKKGASAKYQRASEIFDTLFVLPEPDHFPLMTDEQKQEREKLGLSAR